MALQYRARTYRNVGELDAALNHEAQANWKPTLLCSHGQDGILVVYSSDAPAASEPPPEVAPWDRGAEVAEEANLAHEFPDPREED